MAPPVTRSRNGQEGDPDPNAQAGASGTALPAGNPVVIDAGLLAQLVQGLASAQQMHAAQMEQQRLASQQQMEMMQQGFQAILEKALAPTQKVGGVKEFRSFDPPKFGGDGSPIEAEDWICNVKRLLVAAKVPEDDKVDVVQVLFHGVAQAWFEAELLANGGTMSWEKFIEAFYFKFFPEDMKDDLAEEFLKLTQGDRTVEEYSYKYDQLIKYAKNFVPTEPDRVRRYVKGLKLEIQQHLISCPLKDVAEARIYARRQEKLTNQMKEEALVKESTSLKRDITCIAGKATSYPTAKVAKTATLALLQPSSGSIGQQSTTRLPVCTSCGKGRHLPHDCWTTSGRCFKCGAIDHQVKSCPYLQGDMSGIYVCVNI